MKFTSDTSQKYINALMKEKSLIREEISDLKTYTVATGEEAIKPEFDLEDCLRQIESIDEKILKVKHQKNIFNSITKLPCGLTIDEALVYMSMLSNKEALYKGLATRQPITRSTTYNTIEYTYANYDISLAKERYTALKDEILKIQQELNLVNTTLTFEVEV